MNRHKRFLWGHHELGWEQREKANNTIACCLAGSLRGPLLSWGLSLITLWTVPIPALHPCIPAITGEEILSWSHGPWWRHQLCPNTEPFPLFADCMGRETGGLVSIILTWLSIWGRVTLFSSHLEDWVQQPPVFSQIPYRSTWTQSMFNLGCLWEFESVTVNPAVELCVQRHACPDISTGERSEFSFSL